MASLTLDPQVHQLLTPAVQQLLATPDAYTRFVVEAADAGDPRGQVVLQQASPADLLTQPIKQADAGRAVLSGLWLYFDWLDRSHTLSQDLKSATGSFWHGVMHRREGDFWNSKYWYAKTTRHPAHALLAERLPELLRDPAFAAADAVRKAFSSGWNADRFVDLAERLNDDGNAESPDAQAAVAVQRLEWQSLFECTVREAI